MKQLTFKVDVTGLTRGGLDNLIGALHAQCEAYEDQWCTGSDGDGTRDDAPVISCQVDEVEVLAEIDGARLLAPGQ